MRSSIAKQICGQFRVPNRSKNTKQNFFVPRHNPVKADEIQKLQEFLSDKPKILVLTGAGISTESGELPTSIPTPSNFIQLYNACRHSRLPFRRRWPLRTIQSPSGAAHGISSTGENSTALLGKEFRRLAKILFNPAKFRASYTGQVGA